VILWSVLGTLPPALLAPHLPLVANVIVTSLAGMVLASAFPAMVVYAQDLMPRHTGMVAGLLFGLAFGMAAVGAAVLGMIADARGIHAVFLLCSALPALGLVGFLLPGTRR
jgi:FSR family fosmidomycin resistance protein-like MFS transporter